MEQVGCVRVHVLQVEGVKEEAQVHPPSPHKQCMRPALQVRIG